MLLTTFKISEDTLLARIKCKHKKYIMSIKLIVPIDIAPLN